MKLIKLDTNIEIEEALKRLNVDRGGVKIMSKKMNLNLFHIKSMRSSALNILKQDALSIGAELATPKGVIECRDKFVDALLIGSDKHIEILSKKELAQPFGLKELAKELKLFLDRKNLTFKSKIMGVLNINRDSFFLGSRVSEFDSISKIEQMIEDGADIIDIGGVSSRPNSDEVSTAEEFERVKSTIDLIYSNRLYERIDFSLDSYRVDVLRYSLDRGFKIVNDITGLKDDEVAKLSSEYHSKVVVMHMQNSPKDMQLNPEYEDVVLDIEDFFKERVKKAEDFGIIRDNIILDVGIGFGKRLSHNLDLIKNLGHFKKFGCELLVGASRKSMIDMITPSKVEDRLGGSLAIHLKAIEQGASILRVHDVKEHKQAVEVANAINSYVRL